MYTYIYLGIYCTFVHRPTEFVDIAVFSTIHCTLELEHRPVEFVDIAVPTPRL